MSMNFEGIDFSDASSSSGMISSREKIDGETRNIIISCILNSGIKSVLSVLNNISAERIEHAKGASMVMGLFTSIPIDVNFYNISFLNEESDGCAEFQEIYENFEFYGLTASAVHDKKTDQIVILYEIYKRVEDKTEPYTIRLVNKYRNFLAYLYVRELVSLALHNYKNKFTLSNKAKTFFFQNKPEMNIEMRDQAAVALAQMSMEYHLNSLLLDQFSNIGNEDFSENMTNLIKNSPFTLYDPRYNHSKTTIDILDELLKDAIVTYISTEKK